jgi:hypothetical protein
VKNKQVVLTGVVLGGEEGGFFRAGGHGEWH